MPAEIVNTLTTNIAAATIGALVVSTTLCFLWYRRRQKQRHREARETTFLKILLPKGNEIEITAAEHMFSAIYSLKNIKKTSFWSDPPAISFEIVAQHEDISFYLAVPNRIAYFVEKQLHAAYPEAQIEWTEPYNVWQNDGVVTSARLKLSGEEYFPIKTGEDLPNDPLNAITSAMSKLDEGEALVVQVLLRPAGNRWQGRGLSFISQVKYAKSQSGEEGKKAANRYKYVSDEFLEGIAEKVKKVGFDTCIRLVSVAETYETSWGNLSNLGNSFEQFTHPQFSHFTRQQPGLKKLFMWNFMYRLFPLIGWTIPIIEKPLLKKTSVLNSLELATICHFPNKNVTTPHLRWVTSRKAAPPSNLPPEGLYIGENVFRGVQREIRIKDKDRRRHCYIIGQTGTGKSELLKLMALQDIKNGRGVAFIDPHGSAIDDLLQQIPRERADDVILFSPGDTEYPMGFNILQAKTEEEKHLIVNSFIALLYKLYDPQRQGIIGPRLERAVRNVMLTAMTNPKFTLIEVLRMLINPEFANSLLPNIKDTLVKAYWTEELAKTSDFHKSETLGYFVSKFDRFVTEKIMRNIIGQSQSSFDIAKVMNEGKILLIDLAKGRIGEENSNFLGLIFVPRILAAALQRVTIPEEKRRDFYLYVDEFQNYATTDFSVILSEARKYRLNLTVGNQFLAQLPDEIKTAVFGNVGTLISFRVGVDDAAYLKTQFEPVFEENDLINNPVGHYYLRLLIDGAPSHPFSGYVPWSKIQEIQKDPAMAAYLREESRRKYGRPQAEVEADIERRLQFQTPASADPERNIR